MNSRELCVLLEGREVARLHQDGGQLRLVYDSLWRRLDQAYPLSLSMPLAKSEHQKAVAPYLWGLLPDNADVLEVWGKRFQVSARNPFRLLEHVGEDCPGALQICTDERREELLTPIPTAIEWLDDAEVAARLHKLRVEHTAWLDDSDRSRFSLAGAQPKMAAYRCGARWGLPSGRAATTHILKPGIPGLSGSAENEYYCLELARRVGLPTARTQVLRFVDEVAIVVERYDRILREDGSVARIHQEDFCQALGIYPTQKYQNEGGPSPAQIATILRDRSLAPTEDVEAFVRALVFNWLIGGTDAHGKNYSLLLGVGGRVRLAPLYDVASILPYDHFDARKVKSAMKIGSKYRLHEIDGEEWRKLAKQLRLGEARVIGWARELAERIPEEVAALNAECAERGIAHPILSKLESALVQRSRHCGKLLGT